jgi:quercetin dioxygenase-like cupin family protein
MSQKKDSAFRKDSAFSAATILAPGEGETLNVLGNRCVVKVGAAQTGDLLMTMESHVDPQAGPPPHIHDREDETFYILEGEFEFRLGTETIRACTGAFVYAPRGQAHTFRNISPTQPGRLLVTTAPAGIEAFYRRLNALPPGPPDVAQVIAIAQDYGITIMAPGREDNPRGLTQRKGE